MKKILAVMLSAAAVLAFVGCKNINDVENVANRGITITGINVVPTDSTAADGTLDFSACSGTTFVAGGVGFNAWGGWDADTAFSGICFGNEIRLFPGSKVKAENHTNFYDDLELTGCDYNGGALWTNKIANSGSNIKITNPRDGGTYYVKVTMAHDGSATAELVSGSIADFLYITKVTLQAPKDLGSLSIIGFNADWTNDIVGAQSGTTYTFTVNKYLTGSEFKFRTTGSWSGIDIGTASGNISIDMTKYTGKQAITCSDVTLKSGETMKYVVGTVTMTAAN